MINYQDKEDIQEKEGTSTMGKTIITLQSDLTEEATTKVITEIGRELIRLRIPGGELNEGKITINTAIPEDEVTRFSLIPWVKGVTIEED